MPCRRARATLRVHYRRVTGRVGTIKAEGATNRAGGSSKSRDRVYIWLTPPRSIVIAKNERDEFSPSGATYRRVSVGFFILQAPVTRTRLFFRAGALKLPSGNDAAVWRIYEFWMYIGGDRSGSRGFGCCNRILQSQCI